MKYEPVDPGKVPDNIIWIVPRANQGQPVEVAYSTGIPAGRDANYDADHGDPWMRVTDADRNTSYYRRIS